MNTDNSSPSANAASSAALTEDKTVAIVSYLTIIGFIVAIVLHGNNKTRLGAFHLRQMLGLIVCALILTPVSWVLAIIPFLGWLASFALFVGLTVLWIVGLISALNGQQKPVPFLGDKFQAWFGKAFE